MIIGFCGRARAGKDTATAYLIKQYNFERRSFADPVKKSIAETFNIHFSKIDAFKLDDTIRVAIGYKNTTPSRVEDDGDNGARIIQPDHMWSPIVELTFREFIKRFATEGHRDVSSFGEDVWLNMGLPVDGYYAGRTIAISDVRFQNEVDRINELGGLVCRLKRPGSDPAVDGHRSEQSDMLNGVSYEIMNDTTLDDFYAELDIMLDFVTGKRQAFS